MPSQKLEFERCPRFEFEAHRDEIHEAECWSVKVLTGFGCNCLCHGPKKLTAGDRLLSQLFTRQGRAEWRELRQLDRLFFEEGKGA